MVQSGAHACSYTHVYILARVHADRWRLYEICVVPRSVQSSEKVTGSSMSELGAAGVEGEQEKLMEMYALPVEHIHESFLTSTPLQANDQTEPGRSSIVQRKKCRYCPSDRASHLQLTELRVGYFLIRNGNVYIDASKMKCSDMRIPPRLIFYTSYNKWNENIVDISIENHRYFWLFRDLILFCI